MVGSVQDVWAELRLLLISDQFLADYQVLTVNGNSLAPKRGQGLSRDEHADYQAPPPAHKFGAGKLMRGSSQSASSHSLVTG